VLAEKAGLPRSAFLDFMKQQRMARSSGRYKHAGLREPATFSNVHAPICFAKDMDLGLEAGIQQIRWVPMPLAVGDARSDPGQWATDSRNRTSRNAAVDAGARLEICWLKREISRYKLRRARVYARALWMRSRTVSCVAAEQCRLRRRRGAGTRVETDTE